MNLSRSLSGVMIILINLQQALESRSMNGCVCPGDILTYECTVVGELSTVWTGNAFFCQSKNNEITLLHSRFESENGTSNSCNNGAIVGRSFGVQGNNYTSQLSVTITPETAGKTIICIGDDGTTTMLIFSLLIPSTGPLSLPSMLIINKNDYSSRKLTFSWSPVAPDCPAIHYNILASNCGSCPTTTNHTNVTCTDVPTNDSICTFAVQTVVCGNIAGNISDPINITLYTTESTVKTPMDRSYPTENQATTYLSITEITGTNNLTSSQVYIISFSCLAIALFVGVVVASLIVIAILLKRSKAKIRAASAQSNTAEETTHNEPAYENVMLSLLPSVSAINTQDNVAYGNTRGAGATQDVPIYQNYTGPVGIIGTQDNIAYGHTKTIAGAMQDVPMYEDVTDPIPLVSTVVTQDNVAYGCTQQL